LAAADDLHVAWAGDGAAMIPLTERRPDAPPIATCHWQLLADLLSRRGRPGFTDKLGLAWGCRFPAPGVLFGAMAWNSVLAELTGAVVSIERFADQSACREREIALSAQQMPFVAEVDEFYLPGHASPRQHVVHAVSVLERTRQYARVVDLRVGAEVVDLAAIDFDRMREAPCNGRVEPRKLYALTTLPDREPTPTAILSGVRDGLRALHPRSMQQLDHFIQWAGDCDQPIDVCRSAGERFQAARLLRCLAGERVAGAEQIGDLLQCLTDDWYLVHILGTQPQLDGRRRERAVRLLKRVARAEVDLAELMLR
jgi:hypothetical protein